MTVALSSPTPTPFSKAWAASVPVILLAKALVKNYLELKHTDYFPDYCYNKYAQALILFNIPGWYPIFGTGGNQN